MGSGVSVACFFPAQLTSALAGDATRLADILRGTFVFTAGYSCDSKDPTDAGGRVPAIANMYKGLEKLFLDRELLNSSWAWSST